MTQEKGHSTTLKTTPAPLLGKMVVVTRPKEQAEEFARLLRGRGASVLFIPTIEIAPPGSWDRCDDAIDSIGKYDGLIFTSANAVRSFFRHVDVRNRSARKRLQPGICYAVGPKTGEALLAEGITPTTYPGIESGRDLGEAMTLSSVEGKHFLFLKGNLAGDEITELLRNAKSQVDEVIVYETIAPRDADAQSIREQLQDGSIDVIAFFSPSSVKNLVQLVPRNLVASRVIAVIGSSTLAAVKEAGLEAQIVAGRPTSSDLVEAIVQYYKE
jgi:uroporphyrinogen III methyltransferase/synthase